MRLAFNWTWRDIVSHRSTHYTVKRFSCFLLHPHRHTKVHTFCRTTIRLDQISDTRCIYTLDAIVIHAPTMLLNSYINQTFKNANDALRNSYWKQKCFPNPCFCWPFVMQIWKYLLTSTRSIKHVYSSLHFTFDGITQTFARLIFDLRYVFSSYKIVALKLKTKKLGNEFHYTDIRAQKAGEKLNVPANTQSYQSKNVYVSRQCNVSFFK